MLRKMGLDRDGSSYELIVSNKGITHIMSLGKKTILCIFHGVLFIVSILLGCVFLGAEHTPGPLLFAILATSQLAIIAAWLSRRALVERWIIAPAALIGFCVALNMALGLLHHVGDSYYTVVFFEISIACIVVQIISASIALEGWNVSGATKKSLIILLVLLATFVLDNLLWYGVYSRIAAESEYQREEICAQSTLLQYMKRYPKGTSLAHIVKMERMAGNRLEPEPTSKSPTPARILIEPHEACPSVRRSQCGYVFTFSDGRLEDIEEAPCH